MKEYLKSVSKGFLLIIIAVLCVSTLYFAFEYEEEKQYSENSEAEAQKLNQQIDELKEQNSSLADENIELGETNDELQSENESNSEELDFWQQYAVIVTREGKKYHHYGCGHIEGRDFYILNIDEAEAEGYTPCLDCCG